MSDPETPPSQTPPLSGGSGEVASEPPQLCTLVVDRVGRIRQANAAAIGVLGLPRTRETLDPALWEWRLVSPEGAALAESAFPWVRALREEALIEDVSLGVVTSEGATLWFDFTTVPLGPDQVFVTFLDGAERRNELLVRARLAEEALRESELRFRTLFDRMSEGYAHCRMVFEGNDPVDWVYLAVNPAFETLTGLEGVEGRKVSDVLPGIAQTSPDLFEIYGRVAKTGHPERFESFVETLGTWFSVNVFSPGPDEFVATFENVTPQKQAQVALKQAHEQLSFAQAAAGAGMWEWDFTSDQFIWSPELFRLYGLDPARDEATMATWRRVMHPEDLIIEEARIAKLMGTRDPFSSVYRILLPGGEIRWIQAQGSVEWDAQGQPIRMAGICLDYTRQHHAEEAIAASEARTRSMLRTAMDGVWLLDMEGRLLEVNEAACQMLGRTRREVLGMSVGEIEAKESPEEVQRHMDRLVDQGADLFQSRLHRKDGSWFPVEVSSTFLPDTRQVVSYIRDITERKRIQEALIESEAQFRVLFEGAPDAILLADPETGQILDANQAACRLLDRSHEALVGMQQHELHPPQAEAFSKESFHRHIEEAQTEGRSHPIENKVLRADGTEVPVEVLAQVVRMHRRSVVMGIFRDITERKRAEAALRESEARFRGLLQGIETVAVQSYGTDGTTHYWNRASELLYGFTAEEAIGRSLLDLIIPQEMREGVAQAMQTMWETGEAIPASELSLQRKDGSRVAVYSSHAVVEVPGHPPEMFCMDIDLTDRKRLEEQLHQSQKMESLGTLAGGVAHDMNNVLAAILGLASLHLDVQPPDSSAHRAFATIAKACTRGGALIQSLLGFARQGLAEERELDLNELVRDEVRLLERTTLARIRLEMELAADLWPIRGDASALIHVLMNLCVNAVDAMPDNGTLTLRTLNVAPHWVEVHVVDTGCGMSKAILDKALDPFFTTKAPGKGTGLGLSLAHSTVQAHHGQMEILSQPGQGTQIRLRFPACEPKLALAEVVGSQPREIGPQALSVLLVDDDELIQFSMQEILVILGHTVVTASSGEEALERLQAGMSVDVVILDLNMPGLGGAGTLPLLRALRPSLPVLLATGRADQTALDLVAAHPHVTLLPKPFGMKELQHQLQGLRRT